MQSPCASSGDARPGRCDNRAMSMPINRVALICFLFIAAPASWLVSAESQPDGSADARLRALYTEEWDWRGKELLRGGGTSDRFPRVDAASQQARLAYWTKT